MLKPKKECGCLCKTGWKELEETILPEALYYDKVELFYAQCHLVSSFRLTCELMMNVPWMFTWGQGNHLFCKWHWKCAEACTMETSQSALLSCWSSGIKDTASNPHTWLLCNPLSEQGPWSVDLGLRKQIFLLQMSVSH